MVVINPANGKVSSAKIFDTYESSDRFDDFITNYVPANYIVVAACKDDCVTNLSQKGKQWFAQMGSNEIWKLGYRQAFAFIGIGSGRGVNERRAVQEADEVSVTQMFEIGDALNLGILDQMIIGSRHEDPQFLDKIMNALEFSNNPLDEVREEAEATLKEASRIPGYAGALLKISGNKNLASQGKHSKYISVAASIQFGRIVEKQWKHT